VSILKHLRDEERDHEPTPLWSLEHRKVAGKDGAVKQETKVTIAPVLVNIVTNSKKPLWSYTERPRRSTAGRTSEEENGAKKKKILTYRGGEAGSGVQKISRNPTRSGKRGKMKAGADQRGDVERGGGEYESRAKNNLNSTKMHAYGPDGDAQFSWDETKKKKK